MLTITRAKAIAIVLGALTALVVAVVGALSLTCLPV